MITFALVLLLAIAISLWLIVLGRLEACSRRPPDFVIGPQDNPYLLRWWVIPRNPLFNIYLHEIRRSDDDRALHDHPWLNLSMVRRGGYWEVTPQGRFWRTPGSKTWRLPTAAHRLEVMPGQPCLSLFLTGPRVREWGFHCPEGWKHWKDFVDLSETGAIGPGCGER